MYDNEFHQVGDAFAFKEIDWANQNIVFCF